MNPSHSRARGHLGRHSEQLAARLLQRHGYRLERTNVRFPVGEIDIVAWEGQTLCFVEVRSTSSQEWGGPLASIGARKQQHLIQAARWYLAQCKSLPLASRFDVVSVDWSAPHEPKLELIRGAFDASESRC